MLLEALKVAATYSPTLPAFYLSVKKKKILRSKDTDVRFTELLIGGGEKEKNTDIDRERSEIIDRA